MPEDLERLGLDLMDQFVDGLSRLLFAAASLTIDTLTHIPNRGAGERFYDERREHNESTIVGLADFDHFKLLNDTHGHAVGDDALRAGAKIFDHYFKPFGLAFRYGGEEIGLCLLNCGRDQVTRIIEAVQKDIRDTLVTVRGNPDKSVTFSVSIGLAVARPDESFEAAFDRADDALYQAKRAGRNRSVFA